MFLDNKWRAAGYSLSSVNYIPDLHPATQIEIRRNTPSPPLPPPAQAKENNILLRSLQRENPPITMGEKKTFWHTYSVGGDLCPVRPVQRSAAAAAPHCVAVPPLAGSSVCRGKRGLVGR